MTCIVGLQTPRGVLLAADTAAVSGWDIRTLGADSLKVWQQGGLAWGFSGDARWSQLVRYRYQVADAPRESAAVLPWLIGTVAPQLEALARDAGLWFAREERKPPQCGQRGLIACRGRLYRLTCDLTVHMVAESHEAVGSGEDYALGALDATAQVEPPERFSLAAWHQHRAELALASASARNIGVRAPFTFVWAED